MLTIAQKKRLATRFENWCKENNVVCCAHAMLVFLQENELLNEEKVVEYQRNLVEPRELLGGLKEFITNYE